MSEDRERFKELPKHIALEDTVEEQPVTPPPDPDGGTDPAQTFFLRNAGG